MKRNLTYFFLLVLFLFNGFNSVTALQQAQPAKQGMQSVENRNGAAFFISSNEVEPLVTLFSDDDDDDESRSVKKKNIPFGNFTALIHTLFRLQDQHDIKSASSFQRDVCYSAFDRYILHCTLKI